MAPISPELGTLLVRIARADGGSHVQFAPMFIQNEEHPVFVEPHVEGHEAMLPGAMRALAEAGYLDIDPGASGEFGSFRLTEAGRAEAVRLARSTTRQPVDLSWEAVRPVLVVAVAAVERVVGGELAAFDDIARDLADVMPRGQAGRALETLRDNGYVELVEEMGNDEPLEVRVLPPALQEVRGWPGPMSAEGVVERLFKALDRAIASTEDETQISRLEKLRAAASDVGKSVCQWPSVSPRGRPSVLPAGQQTSRKVRFSPTAERAIGERRAARRVRRVVRVGLGRRDVQVAHRRSAWRRSVEDPTLRDVVS